MAYHIAIAAVLVGSQKTLTKEIRQREKGLSVRGAGAGDLLVVLAASVGTDAVAAGRSSGSGSRDSAGSLIPENRIDAGQFVGHFGGQRSSGRNEGEDRQDGGELHLDFEKRTL